MSLGTYLAQAIISAAVDVAKRRVEAYLEAEDEHRSGERRAAFYERLDAAMNRAARRPA